MDEKYKVRGKDEGLSEEDKAHLKRYLQSQGIENPDMEVTEEDKKKAVDSMLALRRTHGN